MHECSSSTSDSCSDGEDAISEDTEMEEEECDESDSRQQAEMRP